MDRDTFYKKEQEVIDIYQEVAWTELQKNYTPIAYETADLSVFGKVMGHEISGYIEDLSEKYGDNLGALVIFSEREYRFSCYKGHII